MKLSRRKFALFAAFTVALAISATAAGLFALDLFVHYRASRSHGLNIWGYRGPRVGAKEPGELRLAVVGGSTAFGYGLPWFEAAPAVLERQVNTRRPAGRPVSVVNLAYNNEGAYSYRFTLEDFEFLDYDVAVIYDGYNDMMGDEGPNLAVYRHDSPVFRLTGYFPLLPLVLRERAMMFRFGGNLATAYAAQRGEAEGKTTFRPNAVERGSAATMETAASIAEALGRQLSRLSPDPQRAPLPNTQEAGCPAPWSHYCQAMYLVIKYARDRGRVAVVVLQPRLLEPVTAAHASQQAALGGMVTRKFGADANVHAVDLSEAIDLANRDYSVDGVHLSTDGTEIVTAKLAARMVEILGSR